MSQKGLDSSTLLMAGAQKRLRVAMDKQAKVSDLQDQVEGLGQRIAQDQHASFVGAIRHVNALVSYDALVGAMDNVTAKTCSKAILAPTTEQRIVALSKLLSAVQYGELISVEQKVKHSRDLLRSAAELSIVKGYGNPDGPTNWETMRDDLMNRH